MENENAFDKEFEFWGIKRNKIYINTNVNEFWRCLERLGYELTKKDLAEDPYSPFTKVVCIKNIRTGVIENLWPLIDDNKTHGWCFTKRAENTRDDIHAIVGEDRTSRIHELGHVQLRLDFGDTLDDIKRRLFEACINVDIKEFYDRYCVQGGVLQLYSPKSVSPEREYHSEWNFFRNILEDYSINTRMQKKGETISNLLDPLQDFIEKCYHKKDMYKIGKDEIYLIDKLSCSFALLMLEKYNHPSSLKDDILGKFDVIGSEITHLQDIINDLYEKELNHDIYERILDNIPDIIQGYSNYGYNF